MKKKKSLFKAKYTHHLFLLIGLILLVFFIYRADPQKVLSFIPIIGLNFIFILAINLASFLGFSYAWQIALRDFIKEATTKLGFIKIFIYKITGEAVNNLTPLSWGGGDPLRVILLKGSLDTQKAAASVTVDRILNNFAAALIILVGILMTLARYTLPQEIKLGLWIFLVLLIAGSIFIYLRSHQGLFSFLISILKFLRIKRHFSDTTLQKVTETDRYISLFYKEDRWGFLFAFLLHLGGRLLSAWEILLIAQFLHSPLNFYEAYLLYSIAIVINLIFFFIPGRLGVLDGAYQGVFFLMNQDPSIGLGIQLVRRIRTFFWTLLGFLFFSLNKKKQNKTFPQK
ncbi:MAG: flippase-like domain-containing protein [Deltaproteobacteria bacterium]|nr:flippase-like domain-containing protein [Deltaproteobacteria bacterium]